ncbi:AIPR family protein [Bacillus spizizenii]|nr:AIPR family protein [Bacillus spizizenii]MCY7880559.1 AIPR family protein [Bacillus spizizenii]MCY7888570.1 AIPR family protein [Bacillus spizizenii]MCY8324774.1 AIPR family protein [Bacillus spizizenii]MCY8653867.1 AIPR family protein [Bacillus spizizenii]
MDVITKGMLEEFLNINEIKSKGLEDDFEKFACATILENEFNVLCDSDEVLTDPHTQGIDGIGIIVNGDLIEDISNLEDIIENQKALDCTFIFIQTKISSSFSSGDIHNFYTAVKFFFSNPTYFSGEKMKNFIEIKDYIYKNPAFLKKNPDIKLFYVTTGNWQNDPNLIAIKEQYEIDLRNSNLFAKIIFNPFGAKEIQDFYRKTKTELSTTFLFEKRVTIPVVEGIKESYFGILAFKELKKIITDDSGQMRNIFYDNVRDFLGDNPVNKSISNTLEDKKFGFFGVLNNGVTIVADTLQSTGDQFTINNFQIVNGCQTSHVLYNNRNMEGIDGVNIPFRLIITDSDDIKNDITKATNSQTEVKQEELEALSEFQKKLEQYYALYPGDTRLHYERRTNQYASNSVFKTTIISIPTQIKIFSAMFLENPHLVSRYYGTIAKEMGEKIFKKNHELSPYYTSGLTFYRLESFFRSGVIDSKYKKARYHMMMLFRLIVSGKKMCPFEQKAINKYCQKIIEVLNNNDKALEIFIEITEIVDKVVGDLTNRDLFKRKDITEKLIEHVQNRVII